MKKNIHIKEKELKKLTQKIKDCRKCNLCKTRKNSVSGAGPANAKIMVLGQAPGFEEDKTGRPFVGRAGKFLNKLLEIAGIKREKVFITSPIKCFPPKNRKPKKEEIQACLSFLKKQIGIINPVKLILLGRVAFSVFFLKRDFSNFRGKWVKLGDKDFFITYHPAAGLRFPKMKEILEEDFKKLKPIGCVN